MPEDKEERIARQNDGKPNEPILTARQWLLLIATLLAAAIVGNLLRAYL